MSRKKCDDFKLHPRLEKMTRAIDGMRAMIDEFYMELTYIQDHLKQQDSEFATNDLVDIGILMKECEELFDNRRKDAKATGALAAKLLGLAAVKRSMDDPTAPALFFGRLGKGEPDTKKNGYVPRAGSPEYTTFLKGLGVPMEAIETGVLDVSWKNLSALITKRIEDGKPLPEGVAKTYDEFYARFSRIR